MHLNAVNVHNTIKDLIAIKENYLKAADTLQKTIEVLHSQGESPTTAKEAKPGQQDLGLAKPLLRPLVYTGEVKTDCIMLILAHPDRVWSSRYLTAELSAVPCYNTDPGLRGKVQRALKEFRELPPGTKMYRGKYIKNIAWRQISSRRGGILYHYYVAPSFRHKF